MQSASLECNLAASEMDVDALGKQMRRVKMALYDFCIPLRVDSRVSKYVIMSAGNLTAFYLDITAPRF